MSNAELKRVGEDAAERRITQLGMQILHRNWRCRIGELDIVAMDGSTLVFVEVKCRWTASLYDPGLAVDHRKRMKLRKLAEVYLAVVRPRCEECRFDVVSVTAGDSLRVDHIPAAFE